MENSNIQTAKQTHSPLITITDAAAVKIKSIMEKEGKADCGLRFGVVTGGCAGLSYDMRFQKTHFENDFVFEQKGIKVFVNEESADFVKGIEIDYVETLKESGFKYKNPNAKSSCGCGTSFS